MVIGGGDFGAAVLRRGVGMGELGMMEDDRGCWRRVMTRTRFGDGVTISRQNSTRDGISTNPHMIDGPILANSLFNI